MTAVFLGMLPYTPVTPGHFHGLEGIAVVAGGIEVQHHLGGGGGPHLEGGGSTLDHRAQVITAVSVVLHKLVAIENAHGEGGLCANALDLHGIGLGQIDLLCQGDIAGGGFLAQGADAADSHGLTIGIDLYLVQGGNVGFGSEGIRNGVKIRKDRGFQFGQTFQGVSSVVTGIDLGVAALEIYHRFPLGDGDEPVIGIVLGSRAPGASAGVGAISADDIADGGHVLWDVQHDLAAVLPGGEHIALAVLTLVPDPHIGVFQALAVLPVEGDLIVAILQRKSVLGGIGSRRCGFRNGGCGGVLWGLPTAGGESYE